jgi:hypothetical protein
MHLSPLMTFGYSLLGLKNLPGTDLKLLMRMFKPSEQQLTLPA